MKHLKTLGLAAVAAMALTALIGAGSASATALCKTTPTTEGANIGECPAAWTADTIEASLTGTTIFETLGGTVLDTCPKGSLSATTNGTGSTTETVSGNISSLTWGTEANPCTKTTDTISTGSLEIHASGDGHNGTLTGSGIEVTILTIFGSCTYGTGANKDLGTVVGGNPAPLAIGTIVNKKGGNATCPSEIRWTAIYEVTSSPLWVATSVE